MKKPAMYVIWVWGITQLFLVLCGREYKGTSGGLTQVPSDIPADVIEVYLDGNDIGDITTDPFTHLLAIEKLYLDSIGMTRMPAIQSTSDTLKHLYLTGNKITQVPSNYFANFNVLINLRLSGNEIREMGVGSLNGLTALRRVFLDNTPITTFDEYTASKDDLRSLIHFSADGSQLMEFPCLGPYNANKLKQIDIENCQISLIQRDCVDLPGPGPFDITLRGNQLTSIANMSRIIHRVRYLDISNNPFLEEFPLVDFTEVVKTNLQILNLSGTLYPVFPLIQMRHSILEIYAAAARIECVPTTRISALNILKILDLSSNQISLFPDDSCINTSSDNSILAASGINSMVQFGDLQLLNLGHNTLRNFPDLDTAPNLIALQLSFNRIRHVSYDEVAHFKLLQNLHINNNQITSFMYGSTIPPAFSSSLLILDLTNNNLTEIPDLSSLMADIHLAGNTMVSLGNSLNGMQSVQAILWSPFY